MRSFHLRLDAVAPQRRLKITIKNSLPLSVWSQPARRRHLEYVGSPNIDRNAFAKAVPFFGFIGISCRNLENTSVTWQYVIVIIFEFAMPPRRSGRFPRCPSLYSPNRDIVRNFFRMVCGAYTHLVYLTMLRCRPEIFLFFIFATTLRLFKLKKSDGSAGSHYNLLGIISIFSIHCPLRS